ncbi:hypothetical protein PHYSODRAFT_300999 [Phytophthora sojae]|uniref:Uncharacterized protein n=1 Tax=Phytophthora sojae (strain P6497) TaxID=1094619 RepID=G4ZJN7_PHYSP|nr:hypothetical protein PHYSODRAFT_300999 [Phytophthora sojae]EGZ18257.1 hypothetical protein PHYSODRAFT_300999 [Phytophthora sojae]|eukprot:XP_009527315.1 hypothetical protein PHYSODRAFT_300999 [Phytophthora sojae]
MDPDVLIDAAASSDDDASSTDNFNTEQVSCAAVPDHEARPASSETSLESSLTGGSSTREPASGASLGVLSRSVGENNATPSAASHPAFAMEQPPTMLTEDDIERFRTLANSIPQVSGKWEYLHNVFLKEHPDSQLSANALRCRLKDRRMRAPSTVEAAVQLTTPVGRKRSRATSCASCQKKRKRCGDTSVNPSCTRASKPISSSIDSFFSTLSQ